MGNILGENMITEKLLTNRAGFEDKMRN